MLAESNSNPYSRYLLSDGYFPEFLIKESKEKMNRFFLNKEKPPLYDAYQNWKCAKDEYPIFTLYAYADIAIPKKMDTILDFNNTANYIDISYSIEMAVFQGWAPFDSIDHGHKHLRILKFNTEIPPLLKTLKSYSMTKSERDVQLGFCQNADFPAIYKRLEKVNSLKKKYGKNYWEFDDGED